MLNLNNKIAFVRYLFIFMALSFVSGCASLPESNPELQPGLARIKMQSPSRLPPLFKDILYGRIGKVTSDAGETVFLDNNYKRDAVATRFIDIKPGKYKLSARCEASKSHLRPLPTVWMANHSLSVELGETIIVGCEHYADKERKKAKSEEKRNTEKDASYEYLLDKHHYRVRLVTLERSFGELRK